MLDLAELIVRGMKVSKIILVGFLLSSCAHTETHLPNFQTPQSFQRGDTYLGVTYLQSYPVDNPKQILTRDDRAQLVRLFVAVSRHDRKRANQTYPILVSTPIVQLLLTQFPELKSLAGEGGDILMLSDIETFFNNR
jgi:hypothetical protein